MQQLFYKSGSDAFVFDPLQPHSGASLMRIDLQLFDFLIPERDGPGGL